MKAPPDWKSRLLHHVAEVRSGLSKSSKREGPTVRKPYLRVANVQDGFLDLSEIKEIEVPESQVVRFTLIPGDLLLIEGNGNPENLGRGCIWDGQIPECVHQNHVFAVRTLPGAEILPKFLALQLQSDHGRNYLLSCSKGSTGLSTLNSAQLKEFPVLAPSIAEQQQIAETLNTWDAAIEKTERLIAAKGQRNEALSNRILFGHVRFGQRNIKATRALHWFSAPNDWQVVEIGKVAREVSALNGGDANLPVLSCTKYDGLVDSLKYFDKQVFSHDTSRYKIVRRGQFAYATNHIEEGSIGYQDLVPAGLVSPIYTVFQADATQIDDGYLYKVLKTEKLRQLFAANTNASVDRRGSLRWKEFARIHIPLPPLDEQRQISKVLDEAKREVTLLQAKAEALKTQKRGLMQKLLTGQWRIPTPISLERSS